MTVLPLNVDVSNSSVKRMKLLKPSYSKHTTYLKRFIANSKLGLYSSNVHSTANTGGINRFNAEIVSDEA